MQALTTLRKLNTEPPKPDRTMRLETLFQVFFIASIAGWIYEEIFYYITEHFVGNRGFLYGPWLPVYGFGAVLIVLLLRPFKKRPAVLFVLAMLVTGVLEYLTGWAMWEIWHRRWWDYTGLFMNLSGYVCLRSVLSFAVGGLALVYIPDPLLAHFISRLGKRPRAALCLSVLCILAVDLVLSLAFRTPTA